MRKTRFIENCRCYHLISRLAHQAFFLDDDEKTRAIELLRRVEEFSGVIVLAYAIMSNHFHIFIYVPEPEDIGDEEILRRINALYREASLAQVLGEWTRLKDEEAKLLEYSRPTGKYVSRFGEYRRSLGRRHSQQHPFQSLLPFPVAGEGHQCSNRSRSSAVAPAEVLPDMSYYISDTISISSDSCPTASCASTAVPTSLRSFFVSSSSVGPLRNAARAAGSS